MKTIITAILLCSTVHAYTFIGGPTVPPYRFSDPNITYCFVDATRIERSIANRACKAWAKACNVSFTEVTDPAMADIVINKDLFMLPDDYLAVTAHQIQNGIIQKAHILVNFRAYHFGHASETSRTYDLFSVLCHEVGHAIGLGHSLVTRPAPRLRNFSMMFPFFFPGERRIITRDDKDGAVAIYGPRENAQSKR